MQEKMELFNYFSNVKNLLSDLVSKISEEQIKEEYPYLDELKRQIEKDEFKEQDSFFFSHHDVFKKFNNSLDLYLKSTSKNHLLDADQNAQVVLICFSKYKNESNLNILLRDKNDDLDFSLAKIQYYKIKNDLKLLQENINNIQLQQEKIDILNNDLLNSRGLALKIVEELKSKNQVYSQLIDQDSNIEIKKLYESIYDQEIKLANQYRNWALLIFAVIGAFLLFGFLNLSIQNWNHLRDSSYIHIPFGWDSLLKTLMLFSLTTPAWYLTRESSKHRKVAYKAKMLGTELASFPLYAREFKDEDRLELRKSLADRFFGQELYNGSSNTKNTNDVSIEQIKLIAEANKVLAESLKIKQNLS
ncbi:hypothetical protein LZZ98_05960 [Acinetobacter sp. SM34]|uniref:hypothetical protein n=1 Tax=Acinetobacter sp. SM34 TaxID=1301620 RepID=UPI001ED9FC16|nr:hypothetical protein [Acinetobacter sp. SM34]MCG2608083.1 hypothetical protein [Acinetobacter sp. SM34]